MHDTPRNLVSEKEPTPAGGHAPHAHRAVRHPDRARQFIPFAALRGFENMLREQEHLSALRADSPRQDSARPPR